MWNAEVLEVDAQDENRIWVRAPRAFPHGLDELVGAPVTVAGIARSIADVEEPEPGHTLAAGDRLGLILDPLDE
ncbi:hypothetical protein [uncultured Methylobacterium sp.]|jgi:hypothetical protein|uniref:hypothetical protein n=1 Tax=uncultured Methylobacterium sp. TaxID=157278 RepID=UPI002601B356|nr:hypothetical protein [uncultured Methylobacterium sp.]